MKRPIVIAAGGTGGHIFPAEALAVELLARGRTLALVTDRRGAAFSGALAQLPSYTIAAGTPSRGSVLTRLRGATLTALGVWQAHRLLGHLQPGAVVGFGGYPSVPTLLAAVWGRIPTVIHEQNALLGRANRILAPRVGSIALSFASTSRLRAADFGKAEIVGNPVCAEMRRARDAGYLPPADDRPVNILVLGGSQGAASLSRIIPQALASMSPTLRQRLRVSQQCRPEDLDGVHDRYRDAGIHAELGTFFDDVPRRMTTAHLVIARAGASTVAELGIAGRPAILVPYPHASDNHQTENARAFAEAGAGWMLPEAEFTPPFLRTMIERLLAAPQELQDGAAQARAQGRPDAARALADLVDRASAVQRPLRLIRKDGAAAIDREPPPLSRRRRTDMGGEAAE